MDSASLIEPNSHGEHGLEVTLQKMQRHLLQDQNYTNVSTDDLPSGNGRPPAWRARFDPVYKRSYIAPAVAQNQCKGSKSCTFRGLTYPFDEYIMDPTTPDNPQPVIRIWYPKGAWSAGSDQPSGTLFYAYPWKNSPTNDPGHSISTVSAALEYEVYIPDNFDFVKGGKLPGLSGGDGGRGRGCGGGADPSWCFSFRIMWRREGWGEAYLYVPEGMQASDFCTKYPPCKTGSKPCTECNFNAGVSFGRGGFVFQKGQWNRIYLNITLNTPNQTNGIVEVRHNGQRAIYHDKINWRQTDARVEGVEFASWYGGSDNTWAPSEDMYTLIRNMKLWRDDAPAPMSSRVAAHHLPKQQVLVNEFIQVGA